ncbi:hypothetical protein QOZ80_1AG0040520 [Eleusine coracana subsp. coracana]|nr:hypothetical protein QOZ80_1AG0040520 [Eleusine coracana subsp. coracana]
MADSTAMTIDFLRARLLSERSVSRAAKERADELAKRVAELEEQVREVTAQRRQAERAAAEVFAILESQGHLLSDDDGSGGSDQDQDDDGKSRGDTARASGEKEEQESAAAAAPDEAEDAQSGTAQPGGLSWKGRSVSPRKARQLKHKHHRRSYFYLLSSSDSSSPKYRMGQSCRKNKRHTVTSNEGKSASPGEGVAVAAAAESEKGRQDGSSDERSSGDGGGAGQYVIRYEKDGEMEWVLERQAELIGQYEEEEKAQREWEKQYNENQNVNKVAAEAEHKPCQITKAREHINQGASQAAPLDDKVLPKGPLSESPENAPQEISAPLREAKDEPDQSCAQIASVSGRQSSNTSTVTRQNQQDPGDEISDGDSGFNGNAPSPRHSAIKTPSERSPSSDTLDSKVSDWSSSHFHDHTDSLVDRPASSGRNVDVGSVLEALQCARISLSARLSKPVPPSQVMLALPAPGDDLKEHDDLPADEDSNSYREERSSSSPGRQEILALPAPEYYRERVDLPVNDTGISVREKPSSSSPRREEILALPAPGDDYCREIDDYMKLPVCAPGLFRLPTDSFPADPRMFSGNVRGSGFTLGATANPYTTGSFRNLAATDAPSTSRDGGSGFSAQQCYDLYSSVPTASRCNNSIARPDFTIRDTSFLSGLPVPGLGDADLFMQRGIDYTISNKWMM